MGRTPEQMVRMLEICVLNGRDGLLGAGKRMNAHELRSAIRQLIQSSLNLAISDEKDLFKTIEMNYTSYETAIVGVYSVRLVGWTYGDKIVNPGQIGSVDDLRALHEAL
ncbi:hypothetical protein EXIGLDRAFT_820133, partial [Exidia glandulosa HHB12029]